jgi:hypothetical protein
VYHILHTTRLRQGNNSTLETIGSRGETHFRPKCGGSGGARTHLNFHDDARWPANIGDFSRHPLGDTHPHAPQRSFPVRNCQETRSRSGQARRCHRSHNYENYQSPPPVVLHRTVTEGEQRIRTNRNDRHEWAGCATSFSRLTAHA